jgi:hypothetical protein
VSVAPRSPMSRSRPTPQLTPPRARRAIAGSLLTAVSCLLALPAASPAKVVSFGSPLAVAATLDTAEGLAYQGTNTAVPASPRAPTGNVHTYHYGADGALWNTSVPGARPTVPASGQILEIRLKGCAGEHPGGPAPLTQIHFQDLAPLAGGAMKVKLTTQAFDIPVCGHGGAGGSTVTAYRPDLLCVAAGDYIALNEEGGFVEGAYQSGVPYAVLGAVGGASTDSFIRGGATNNGDIFSPGYSSAMDGFAANPHREMLLQAVLGTGRDGAHNCPGGTAGAPPRLAPLRVSAQTDGVNHSRVVAVAIFCRRAPACNGVATLTVPGLPGTHGRTVFSLMPGRTIHLPIKVSPELMILIRSKHGISALLTAETPGARITRRITVKIF